jgi:hypothetical protein
VGGDRPAKEPSNPSRIPTSLFPPRHNHRANPRPIPPRTPPTPAHKRSPASSKEPHPKPPTAGQPSTTSAPVQMKPNGSPAVLGGDWRTRAAGVLGLGICGERAPRQPGRNGRERSEGWAGGCSCLGQFPAHAWGRSCGNGWPTGGAGVGRCWRR